MKRREFITLLGGAGATWPLAARAQVSGKRPLIGWLGGSSATASSALVAAFLKGMQELGYVEGKTFDITYRFAEGHLERLPALAEDLVRLKADVILAFAVSGTVAAKKATSTIPIVTPALADAVELGLIASDARPGGNVTGLAPYVAGLPGKQLEIAREVIPGATLIGVLDDISDVKSAPQRREIESMGPKAGVKIVSAEAGAPDQIDSAFQMLAGEHVQAVIVLQSSMFFGERRRIAASAAANRLPTTYGYREQVEAGGLISYGIDLRACAHRSAAFVDKILKGTNPGEIPVEFPTKLELVINLKTARTLGLNLSPTLLDRADDVIE
jgi:putative ABC transport system substrate-binding protein